MQESHLANSIWGFSEPKDCVRNGRGWLPSPQPQQAQPPAPRSTVLA